ncbi:MAG: flagellar biosynthesis protein FlhA [Candidatus Kapabacteria bacterium]|nr:flagellar biosynthesis protein FlhA [Candidatus Kapabacteria bacterium]MDW8224893.1 flagellar biosynthesis protein FlhA [Bacteroidota bacterium]
MVQASMPAVGWWQRLQRQPDVAVAVGILGILTLLIFPLPTSLLDLLLALNITVSLSVLLVAIYVRHPLELTVFPSLLLLTTLFRLGLNVATTRLILGQADAGEIIRAFGGFVVAGNYVVGFVIFLILVLINFVVIVKGANRIAEVAARFTLDALPGKQMSIDAELNAGFITEQEARQRREQLSREADFYGAMDGAAKFVRGDAIAGLVITVVNIVGGLIIGIAQRGMELVTALQTYTMLTIGDGLVAQIPALLISVAAGMVVARSSTRDRLEVELGHQFGQQPRALAATAAVAFVFALLPGLPTLPFLVLAILLGSIAYVLIRRQRLEEARRRAEEAARARIPERPAEPSPEELLRVDPVEVELGYGLLPLVDETRGGNLLQRVTNVRRQLAAELGILLPPVRIRDNLRLESEEYLIRIRGNEVARNKIYPGMVMAMNPGTAEGELSGIYVTEPVFGLPAVWIPAAQREEAELMGYTVVEAATVLITHLTELLRRNVWRLLTRQDVRQLLENLRRDYPALVDEVTPETLPLGTLQHILQNLLREGIPVRDLALIVETALEYAKTTKNTEVLTEYVRHALGETIRKLYQDSRGTVHVGGLSPELERVLTTQLQQSPQTAGLATLGLPPEMLQRVRQSVARAIEQLTTLGYPPVLICSTPLRPYVYRMLATTFPMLAVLSYTELPPDTQLDIVATVTP